MCSQIHHIILAEEATKNAIRIGAGYKLDTGEVDRLLDQLDLGHTGRVAKGQFAASQIDWGVLQKDHSRWLECVRGAFAEFDTDGDGVCSVDEIVRCLKAKLPLTEVRNLPTLLPNVEPLSSERSLDVDLRIACCIS